MSFSSEGSASRHPDLWHRSVLLSLILAASGSRLMPSPPAQQKQLTDDSAQELLLRDFQPVSMLRVTETQVEKARFPLIDIHGHLALGEGTEPDHALQVMDACNVRTIVNFDGGSGERLARQQEKFASMGDRVIHFARLNWDWINDPDFSSRSAVQLEADVKAGARGLKISKILGLYLRDDSGKLVAVNDPRFDAIWHKCGELGIPVAIHTADPDAFFLPLDGHNEQYESLKRNPAWHFYGKDFPSKSELLEQRNDIIERHPDTTFIGLHVANRAEDLSEVAGLLERLPNLYVEFGARVNELGRQPYTARKFFLKYSDRILFGLDRSKMNPYHYRVYIRFLETEDEYFPYDQGSGLGRWRIYGIHLPDEVLKKVYFENAERLLKLR